LFYVYGIEQAYLVEMHNVLEVPANQHIYLSNGGKPNMKRIVIELRGKNTPFLIKISYSKATP